MDGEVEAIVRGLTKLRVAALMEIFEAGDAGLGFGRSPFHARRHLLKIGLSERLPNKGSFSIVRERLTPLGLRVRQALETAGEGRRG